MTDPVEPWRLRFGPSDLQRLPVTESLFALSNGHIGLRGSLDEGEPSFRPGTYINGFYEERPMPHPEAGYGFPASGQTLVNVTDGKLIRLVVGDSPFDTRYGTVMHHERSLDLRTGILRRETDWTSPHGALVRVTSERLVSFAHRTIAAINYEVVPVDEDLYLVLQSDLLANEPERGSSADPREAAGVEDPMLCEVFDQDDDRAILVHRTARSGLLVAAGMRHLVEVPGSVETRPSTGPDLARFTVAAKVPRGGRLRLVKLLSYGWSSRRSPAALHDQVDGGLTVAGLIGWDGLVSAQREFLDEFWRAADVEVDGDPPLQQAVRLSTFHVLQAAARTQGEGIPAKGLTGPGYDGHTFWDSETFVLPVLTYTFPEAAAGALRWRHRTLPQARARAGLLGLAGAAFAWRTINGEECSGYWPAGTAAFHLAAAVADATARLVAATGDAEFESAYGVDLLVETARLWISLGHYTEMGDFRIHGVTGPDEYTAIVDDNVYTNLMAQRNLEYAAAACRRHPEGGRRLGVTPEELESWQTAARSMYVPYDGHLGVHPQSEGFTRHDEWDFEGTRADQYPLLLHFPYFQIYRRQVVKQADLVLALHLRGDAFSAEAKARDFAYYEPRTVRDSSLSACTQAVVAAEVGHLQLAHDYWAETALTDLHNLHDNVGSGLHLAAMAGTWLVAVAGFGGMRDHDGQLTFAPRLPPGVSRLTFRMRFAGCLVEVEVRQDRATYRLLQGDARSTRHHAQEFDVTAGGAVTLDIPPLAEPAAVSQPPGHAPARRRLLHEG